MSSSQLSGRVENPAERTVKRVTLLAHWHSPGFRKALDYFLSLSPEVRDKILRTGELEDRDE